MNLTPYHAKYFAHELTKRCSSDSVEKLAGVLADAQVELHPHQIDASLFAFRSPLSRGAIIADEVGLGKTISAGILISQKWAERKRKLLVIVPANLRKQWSQELSDKFFLPSLILETRSFNEEIKRGNLNPFLQPKVMICSYQFARSKDIYVKLVEWDLVIIDEAHRLRNVYKPTSKIANAIKQALADRPKVLLTATPLQNSLLELYGLVSIVDDFTFGDLKSFKSQFTTSGNEANFEQLKERIKPIIQRTLRRQVRQYISFTNRKAIVQEFYPTEEEQKLYDLVSEYLQRENLFALPASQRSLMTLILRRLLASSTFAIASTLGVFASRLDALAAQQNAIAVTPEEIGADIEGIDETIEEWDDDEEPSKEKEEPVRLSEDGLKQLRDEAKLLNGFVTLAQSILKNSKGEVLLKALNRGLKEATAKGAQKKAIIFTESVKTQEYLRNLLEQTEFTGKIVLFNGTNNDPKSKAIYKAWLDRHAGTDRVTGSPTADMRAGLVDYFRDEAVIMIATEAAAEGINLQFCSLVVNYDLPWNPQRIEQRIGRCHRYGQKCDVVVVNFLNKKNAADQRVYQLLDEKFKLFEGVFGASDEVLGAIESGVDFEKRISKIMQECRTPEQIELNFNQLQADLEDQIGEAMKQTRQKLLENFDEEVQDKLRIKDKESRSYLNKYEDWLWQITRFYLNDYATFEDGTDAFVLNRNPFPKESIHPGPYRRGKEVEDVNLYRAGHPLAQRIIEQCKALDTPSVEIVFQYSGSGKNISAVQSLIGIKGWFAVKKLTVTAFEAEDHLLFSGIADDGSPLHYDQCQRMFSLLANQGMSERKPSKEIEEMIERGLAGQRSDILQTLNDKNSIFFEVEVDKLDNWGEDQRDSLKTTLKDLDEQIKVTKKEARLAPNLPEKLRFEREKRNLDLKRDEAWKQYDNAIKEVDIRKDALLTEIEKRLQQNVQEQSLFTIRWSVA